MACTTPLLAHLQEWVDTDTGEIVRRIEIRGTYTDQRAAFWASVPPAKGYTRYDPLKLPCGKCPDCQSRHKLLWAHRCTLEAANWEDVTFATLTYADAPWTLSLRDLQLFHKRLRIGLQRSGLPSSRARPGLGILRPADDDGRDAPGLPGSYKHFSCGEYGETHGRPHYHAILFGLGPQHYDQIDKAWGHGFVHLERAGPGAIAYVAGYVNKKRELLTSDADGWVNPFIKMSRGGRSGTGIAGDARKKFRESWRNYAVMNGNKIPVSRYLHNGWKDTATQEEIENLEEERKRHREIHGEEKDENRRARQARTETRLEHSRSKRRTKGTH